jgi:hypothetical protein
MPCLQEEVTLTFDGVGRVTDAISFDEPIQFEELAVTVDVTPYGSSGPGIHAWWLIVKVCTLARPETARGARSFAWQRGESGCGG